MGKLSQKYSVAIVGRGVTGLSTAYNLMKRGIKDICLIGNSKVASSSAQSSGILSGGQRDNITRVAVAHGEEFAKALWTFGDQAFDELLEFLNQEKISYQKGTRQRLVSTPHEMAEVEKAVKLFKKLDMDVALQTTDIHYQNILAIQTEGERSAVCNAQDILIALESKVTCDKFDVQIESIHDLKAEFLVFAAHLENRKFAPNLASALVSVCDQWLELDIEWNDKKNFPPLGSFFSIGHGYEWGALLSENRLRYGGARFLRKMAGIEAQKATVEKKVTDFLLQSLTKTFPSIKNLKLIKETAVLDCIPCDELPIVGPLSDEPKHLIATGYMGSGLTMGFKSGKCLAELIATGKSVELPRRLWPERLRSL